MEQRDSLGLRLALIVFFVIAWAGVALGKAVKSQSKQ